MKQSVVVPFSYEKSDDTYTINVTGSLWPVIQELFREVGEIRECDVEFNQINSPLYVAMEEAQNEINEMRKGKKNSRSNDTPDEESK